MGLPLQQLQPDGGIRIEERLLDGSGFNLPPPAGVLSNIHSAAELNSHKRFLPDIEILLPHHRRLDPLHRAGPDFPLARRFRDALTGGQ